MTGNTKVWRAPLAGLASVAMIATMGVAATTANAVEYSPENTVTGTPTFTVTFDAGSRGNFNKKKTLDVNSAKDASGRYTKVGYKVDAPQVTVNTGYTFTGWYTAPTGGDRVEFAGWSTSTTGADEGVSADPITKDVTLYAHYAKAGDDLLTVTFGNGSPLYDAPKDNSSPVSTFEIASGDKLADWQKPVDKVDGTIIDSWTNDLNAAVTKDTSFAPKDTTTGALVTFHVDSDYTFPSEGADVHEVKYETKIGSTLDANPVAVTKTANAADAANPGYRLVSAWKVGSGENVPTYTPGSTTISGKTDIYGLNDVTAYKVYFVVDGHTAPFDGAPTYAFNQDLKPAYVPAQSAITAPDLNLYDGLYQVKSWSYISNKDTTSHVYAGQSAEAVKLSNENQTDPKNLSNFDITLHGDLEPSASQQYTVTFDENYGNGVQTEVKVAKGATVAVPATPTRDGYRFLGWYDAATNGSKFDFNTKINANTTLYAQWKLVAQYDLDYLLGLTNKKVGKENKPLYTENSYNAYEKVRADIAKNSEDSINANKGTWTDGNGVLHTNQANGPLFGYYAIYTNDYLTDAKVAELTKTLQAAYEKLVLTDATIAAFTDVDRLTPHAKDIWELTAQGVIKGFDNGDGTFSFGGTKNILRQDFAAFLYRLAGEPAFDVKDATKTFTDVNASTPHYKEILWAASNGVIGGFADGTFRGDQQILRQDAAAMLYRLVKGQNIDPTFDPADEPQFTDVNEATPHYTAIMFLAKYGVIRGFADGSFGGTKTIIRQDAAAFLNRLANTTFDGQKVEFKDLYNK